MIDVIYLAAGQGKRARLGYPKQFARLGGKPILVHGLEVLRSVAEVNKIIVVTPPDGLHETWNVFKPYIPLNNISAVEGGETRQQSVKHALGVVTTGYVLVAEAVRPFITAELVKRVIDTPGQIVTPWINPLATPVDDAGNYYDRAKVGQVQMPQKFETRLLLQAHNIAFNHNFTDDVALAVEHTEVKPVLVDGIEENIKITTPLDLVIAEAIYRARQEQGGE